VDLHSSGFDLDAERAAPTEKEANSGASTPPRPASEFLADYIAFSGTTGPDPRTVSIGAVADTLCKIIDVEGPMIAKRAYDVYLRGCGIKRLRGELKSTLDRALASAIRQGRVMAENVTGRTGLILSTVRSKDAPAVKPRRRGPRSFDEIPSGELRAVAKYLSGSLNLISGSEEHLRAIVESFDLGAVTPKVNSALLEALNGANDVTPAPVDAAGSAVA
jgi:hypothetical protein